MRALLLCCLLFLIPPAVAPAQDVDAKLDEIIQTLDGFRHRLDALEKRIDDGLWFDRVGDVAHIDKVRLWGPPRWKEESPTAIGAVWAPWITRPRKMKNPPMKSPTAKGSSPIFSLLWIEGVRESRTLTPSRASVVQMADRTTVLHTQRTTTDAKGTEGPSCMQYTS